MKTRKFLWALLPVAAVLLMTACGGDDTDDVTPTPTPNPVTPGTENVVKSVPYSVTVKTADVTRTSVDNDDITLRFEATDKLYVQNDGGTVYGCLELKNGAGETSATFAGTVNYTGATPAASTPLTATLVGSENLLDMIGTDGKVKGDAYISIPATPCESMSEAVSKYSWIRGTGTYGEATFTLVQRTAFMMFSVTIQDGTAGNVSVPVKITNDNDTYSFSQTTTGSQFDAHISFVLPFEEGKTIDGDASMCVANVSNDTESILIGTGTDVTLAGGNVYPVTRTKDFVRLWEDGPVWATKNLGANSVKEYGKYYAWGETKGYAQSESHNFSWTNYTLCNGSNSTLKRYNNNNSYGTVDNKTEFADYNYADDAAYAASNGTWRIPTVTEFDNLLSNTTNAGTTVNGVNGRTFTGNTTGYTGKAIFLPAAGNRNGSSFEDQGTDGYYWSSSLDTSLPRAGHGLYFNTGTDTGRSNRFRGQSVRPVRAN